MIGNEVETPHAFLATFDVVQHRPSLVINSLQDDHARIFRTAQVETPYPLVQYAWDATLTESSNAKLPRHGTTPSTPSALESAKFSPCEMDAPSAAIGNVPQAATTAPTTDVISVLGVPPLLMECKLVLERRKLKACTPYDADAFKACLNQAVLERYSHVPEGLRQGFHLNFPTINITQSPLNKDLISTYAHEFLSIIKSEIQKERYIANCRVRPRVSLVLFNLPPSPLYPNLVNQESRTIPNHPRLLFPALYLVPQYFPIHPR